MPPGGTKPEKQSIAWPEATHGEIRTARLALLLRPAACAHRTNLHSQQQQQFSELRQSKAKLWLQDKPRNKQNSLWKAARRKHMHHCQQRAQPQTPSYSSLGSHTRFSAHWWPWRQEFYPLTDLLIKWTVSSDSVLDAYAFWKKGTLGHAHNSLRELRFRHKQPQTWQLHCLSTYTIH